MDPQLLPFAERQAPRYTSYPSANHFDASVNAETYGSWLRALSPDTSLSLYLHVPYCRELCWYCGCNTYLTRGGDIGDFVTALMMEVDLVASKLGSHRVGEIHWGGGTPNVLSPEQFSRLVRQIHFWFDVASDVAHAVELDPRYVTRELAEEYVAAGVGRASLGVQDLNPHVQKAIGRVQPIEQVRQAVETLRGAGLTQLSFDLMYGLSGQTADDLARTIRLAADLQPNRIALFGYAHVPWFKRRQRLINAEDLPGASERFDQAELARSMLNDLGYESVGLDHFARPDDPLAISARNATLKRNFQGYVAQESAALIGLGPSAISHLPGGYVQNITTVTAWRHAVEADTLPIARGHAETAEDLRRNAIIQSIMCTHQVDLGPWGGWDMFPDAYADLRALSEAGLVMIENDELRIPDSARQFSRLVAAAFDAYAQPSQPAHSRAI
ncbi:MAG: oxygen-independent coproporphyrinogen III oxidase [Hyphomonadaceae bacterium]|nr:oxygen-independent coproporphyrinogen III oxidase [Hyphomonadaceae bacterium]